MKYPGATWRGPVPNMVSGGMAAHRLLVLHIQEGTEAGTDAWFHNAAAQVSAHFGNPKTGAPDQWVDTNDTAWAEAAYNDVAVSIENEGNSGDSLTASQLENAAQILAWAHTVHGIPLQVTNDPAGSGVIGHGLLGVAGGNHPDCPGTPILNQRQAIVDRAAQILQGDTTMELGIDTMNAQAQIIENRQVGLIPATPDKKTTSLGVETASGPARWARLFAQLSEIAAAVKQIGTPPPANVDLPALEALIEQHLAAGSVPGVIAAAVLQHLSAATANAAP